MPTYEYECNACDHKWELFQSITANAVKKCPACGKNKAKRLIGSGASIIFKGSGFYATDYRSDSYKKEAKADSDAALGKKDETKATTTESSTKKSESSTPKTSSEKKKDSA